MFFKKDKDAQVKKLKETLKNLEKKEDKKVKPTPIKKVIPLAITKYVDRVVDEKGITVDLDKDKFYFEAKPFTYWKKKISFRRWKERRMLKKFPAKVVLIRMEMNNGTHREFLVKDDAAGFTFNGGRYVFDLETRYWVTDSLIWAYDFHESLSIAVKSKLEGNEELMKLINKLEKDFKSPIKRNIPVNDIKETIEHSGITQVENSINPIVLERLIKSEIIQAILQGSALGRLFRVLLIIVIIIVILVALDVVIDFISSDLPNELGLTKGEE